MLFTNTQTMNVEHVERPSPCCTRAVVETLLRTGYQPSDAKAIDYVRRVGLAGLVAVAALLGGCGVNTHDRTWSKPGATTEDFKRDDSDCYWNATTRLPDFDVLNKCMRAKGWTDAKVQS